ncbi:MAG TPA: choice-of-anchor J domain-containing protein [Candidatus Cloacimonadota bacterium]|nr:choice-of-anchor J domain-containing protein [Candidatus Cloacimonadota bacterium]
MLKLPGAAIFLLFLSLSLAAETVEIGSGALLNQALPWEPVSSYNYSQQLFFPDEIGSAGLISSLGFNYRVTSANFFNGNRLLKIWLGHTTTNTLQNWIPVDNLNLVFDGNLELTNYSTTLPGTGWLTIPLSTVFDYNGTDQLLLVIDENSPGSGSTSDDFYCSETGSNRSLRYHSQTLNPDPLSPPQTGFLVSTKYSNLRLEIQQVIYPPHSPQPPNASTEIPIDTGFAWQSSASSWDFYLGQSADALSLRASGLTSPQWIPAEPFALMQSYFWQVVAHEGANVYPGPVWQFSTAGETLSPPQNLSGYYDGSAVQLSWQPPANGNAQHYHIWRNGFLLDDTPELSYTDSAVNPNVYLYQVMAVNGLGQISLPSNQISVTVPFYDPDLILSEGFESYPPFSAGLAGWTLLDQDASPTWSFDNANFPGEGEAHAWLVFNPSQTTPPLSGLMPWEGSSMLASISATSPPNNDWLISPRLNLGLNPSLNFYARSHTADYGLERLRVLISNSPEPASFITLHTSPWIEIPAVWTEFSSDLSAWQNQSVYLAWNAVSWDALALYIDAIEIRGEGGSGLSDDSQSPALIKLYPNPSRGDFKLQSAQGQSLDLQIFDLKGRLLLSKQKLKDFDSKTAGLNLSSGVYLLKVIIGHRSTSHKLLILK